VNISHLLQTGSQALQEVSSTPRLDIEVLLAYVLKKDRAWVLAHPEYELSKQELQIFEEMVDQRSKGEPVAYIIGQQEFFGRKFKVSPDTLTPRAETETMVELAIKHSKQPAQFIDVGTGSGCIISTLALELTNDENTYTGVDISKPALTIAQENNTELGSGVTFKQYDLMSGEPLPVQTSGRVVILANLPYVPDDFVINLSASHEPDFAIYGGADGLDYYRILFSKLRSLQLETLVFTESLPTQYTELQQIASEHDYKQIDSQDFIQVFTNQ
jgi:release factor glutamine methyltransferase